MPALHHLPRFKIWLTALFFFCTSSTVRAYSILTHEALIDVNWEKLLLPLLKQKYPGSTDEQLKDAHAYAYGGAAVPDMGYSPGSSILFSNLIHYVRSGDFVMTLLNDAQDLNEYAFALGVLSHYEGDQYGHRIGINKAVPVTYPKVGKKFGMIVTYEDDPIAHVRVEFSFDVLQTARGDYVSATYHDFIGFKVARPLLEKAFLQTYGIPLHDLFSNLSRTIGTFRWIIRSLTPVITRAAWASKKGDIKKLTPNATARTFTYKMHRKNYLRDFASKEERPPFFGNLLSLFMRIAPKIGPFRFLKFKAPGPDAEKLYIQSFDTTVFFYAHCLEQLHSRSIPLANIDYDTGLPTAPGEYGLADKAYGHLLGKLKDRLFDSVTVSLQQDILSFYREYKPGLRTKKEKEQWQHTAQALEQLKTMQPVEKR